MKFTLILSILLGVVAVVLLSIAWKTGQKSEAYIAYVWLGGGLIVTAADLISWAVYIWLWWKS